MPATCAGQVCFNGGYNVSIANSAGPLQYFVRNDRNNIVLWDILSKDIFQTCIWYTTRVQRLLPSELRTGKYRLDRFLVYGSGRVTDGFIGVILDGTLLEAYRATAALPIPGMQVASPYVGQSQLFYQELSTLAEGETIQVVMCLAGYGIVIGDVVPEGFRVQ